MNWPTPTESESSNSVSEERSPLATECTSVLNTSDHCGVGGDCGSPQTGSLAYALGYYLLHPATACRQFAN